MKEDSLEGRERELRVQEQGLKALEAQLEQCRGTENACFKSSAYE